MEESAQVLTILSQCRKSFLVEAFTIQETQMLDIELQLTPVVYN